MEPVYIKINERDCRYYYGDKAMTILHRTDGPAIEYADGAKFWYTDGQLHRTDGPAVESRDGAKFWYVNGQLHRTDGPAVEDADGTKEWYLGGKLLTEKEFLAVTVTLDDLAAKFGVPVENLKKILKF